MKLISARSSFAPRPHVDDEAGASDLRGSLKIEDAELGSEIPVRFGRERERRDGSPAADLDIILGASASGNGFVRQVRDAGHHLTEGFVEFTGFLIERGDPVAQFPDLELAVGGVLARLAQLADLLRFGVLLRLELLGFGERGAALGVELAERLDVEREGTIR